MTRNSSSIFLLSDIYPTKLLVGRPCALFKGNLLKRRHDKETFYALCFCIFSLLPFLLSICNLCTLYSQYYLSLCIQCLFSSASSFIALFFCICLFYICKLFLPLLQKSFTVCDNLGSNKLLSISNL